MPERKLRAAWTQSDAYERWAGRWSRRIAEQFVPWLRMPAAAAWLDVGCGTGVVSEVILRRARPDRVAGVDRSEGYLAEARRTLEAEGAVFVASDAEVLPFGSRTFDAVVSGLLLNFLADPPIGVGEMARVARRGGTVGAYVWDYLEGMEIMRRFWDAAARVDPRVNELPEVLRYPLCQPEPLRTLFDGAGLREVQVTALEAPAVFEDFDDYWQPFLGGQGTAPTYLASLSDERRATIRQTLKATLPVAPDGGVHLTVRAWAVRGTV